MEGEEEKSDRIDSCKIQQTVEALLAFISKKRKEKQQTEDKVMLFNEENEQFEIQVSVWKVGGRRTKTVPIPLPHNMYESNRDALLFVKDIKKKHVEVSTHHFKDLLTEKGVEGISEVMPLRVLKKEYKPFEAKRNLAKSYNMFLADVKIFSCLSDHLGKEFYKRNKYPVIVDLDKKDLKGEIAKAMKAAYINLSSKGSCSSTHIAHTGMSTNHIIGNVQQAITTIGEKIGGGWDNIKAVHLSTKSSISLPLYTNLIRPEWDFKKTSPPELTNEDVDNLNLQLKLEQVQTVKSLRKKKDLHPSEPLKIKKQKTSPLFNAPQQTGLSRKQRKQSAAKNTTQKQRRRQRKVVAKLREKV